MRQRGGAVDDGVEEKDVLGALAEHSKRQA
jgi:hypothetical protein